MHHNKDCKILSLRSVPPAHTLRRLSGSLLCLRSTIISDNFKVFCSRELLRRGQFLTMNNDSC